MGSIAGGATVYAKDMARVSRFYEQVCGLVMVAREPSFVVLENGALQIVVVEIPDAIARSITIQAPPERREDTALKLTFVVQSIAASRSAAQALGGTIDGVDCEWHFSGMRVCDGHDPEGNVIQVREHAL
jgi:predicted enzyme related to lactoylglutathione lyase